MNIKEEATESKKPARAPPGETGKTSREVNIQASDFANNVNLVLNRQYQSSKGNILIGRTPKVLTDIGLNKLPLTISPNHIYTIAKTKAEALRDYNGKLPSKLRNANFHGLGVNAVLDIYNQISNPIMVLQHQEFTENQQNNREAKHKITVVVEFNVNGKQVIAPIEIDAESAYNSNLIDANHISTYFDRNNFSAILKEAIAKENIGETGFYYIDKKRAASIFTRERQQLPNSLKTDNSNIIIRNIDEVVNRKLESFLTSRQFLRWFGDWTKGKVHPALLNNDGTPKVFYHGSPNEFTVFDKKKARSGYYGRGFYFTAEKSQASVYGNVYIGSSPVVVGVMIATTQKGNIKTS